MSSAPGVVRTVRNFAGLVRLSHSIFALPFAVLSLLVATAGTPSLATLVCVVGAVVAARTAAMAYNRLADREHDARNPRTANREIPRGAVSPRSAAMLTGAAALGFLACCRALSPLCFWLGVPTLVWLLGYSHVKRFSALCHLWLGVALGISPLAAWLAADGAFGPRLWAPFVLGLAVASWVAGFDVLYACQDVDFDRRHGLHSLPARFGPARAMMVARVLHALALAGFLVFGQLAGLGTAWQLGVLAAGALLVWQHRLLRPDDLSRIQMAFFTANGIIALLLLVAGCVDLYALGTLRPS